MTLLQMSNRCKLFEEIASEVWSVVKRNHLTNVQPHETGITNNTVLPLLRLSVLSNPNIGIWANNAYREVEHGGDIDVFVETYPGQYVWWALQAKVLRLNNRYEGVRNQNEQGEYQWDRLEKLSIDSGCISRYLLYNGVNDYVHSDTDQCNRSFEENQFGCSLVYISDFKNVAITRDPEFTDFHPNLAQPWRIITCCVNGSKDEEVKLYSAKQIRKAVTYYPESNKTENFIVEFDSEEIINDLPEDAIILFSDEIERAPEFRIVIRSTQSINLSKILM